VISQYFDGKTVVFVMADSWLDEAPWTRDEDVQNLFFLAGDLDFEKLEVHRADGRRLAKALWEGDTLWFDIDPYDPNGTLPTTASQGPDRIGEAGSLD
jgi:hypothetical protein